MRRRSIRRRNARNRANVLQVAAIAFTAIPLAMGCAAVAAAIGGNFALSMQRAALVTYALVETQATGESDIRDHGLTAGDCRAALFSIHASNREAAGRFTCEAETVAR